MQQSPSEFVHAIRASVARRYAFERRLARSMVAQIPKDKLRALQEKHQDAGPRTKYLDLEKHIHRSAKYATALGLRKSRPLKILDLGCGSGYFLAVAKHLGHDAIGVDGPDKEIYDDFVDLLEVPRVTHRIKPYTPLPDVGKPLNLITGHQVRFNFKGKDERWNYDEWRYFLSDCKSRLAPGGRVRLELNPGHNADYRYMPEEIVDRLREFPGASIPENRRILTVAV